MLRLQRVLVFVLAIGAVFGCLDSTPIGTIECIGERIRCGFTREQLEQNQQIIVPPSDGRVSSVDVDRLMPTWTGRPFPNEPGLRIVLVADSKGDLWSISSPGTHILIAQLDREGEAIKQYAIEAPKGTRDPESLQATLETVSAASGASPATALVSWNRRNCDGQNDPPDCSFSETFVFDDADIAKAPRRMNVGLYELNSIRANDSGEWLAYGGSLPHLDKRDAAGNLSWRQAGLVAFPSMPESWQVHGTLDDKNQLRVFVSLDSFTVNLELLKVDARGNIATRHVIGWAGSAPTCAIDPQGRDVIVGTTFEGDLTMMRVLPDGTTEGSVVARQEFQPLRADSYAIDSEGALYITTLAGGRDLNQQRALLCRLPSNGSALCFALGQIDVLDSSALVDSLVVPEPGVAYVKVGPDLRRDELPQSGLAITSLP
jgi:hypothetical protein